MIIDEIDDVLFPVEMFDIPLLDIHSREIREVISKKLKIKYLSDSNHTEVKEANGTMFGPYFRIFVSLPVKIKHEVKNVHFLVDTGSPKTFICKEVYGSFKATTLNSSAHRVLINNNPTIALLPPINSHFTDVNLLGTEYLKTFDARLIVDFENEYVSLSFHPFDMTTRDEEQNNSKLGLNILDEIVGFSLFCLVLYFIFKRKPLFLFSAVVLFLFNNAFNFMQNRSY